VSFTAAAASAIVLALAVGYRSHDSRRISALAEHNCRDLQQVKAAFVGFVADITHYDLRTRRVEQPAGSPPLTAAQKARVVELNETAARRFKLEHC
jgi:hypothetical protein